MSEYQKPNLSVEELSRALFNVSQQLNDANLKLKESNEKLTESNWELQISNEKLLASEKARNEMFANISHDLRSPITALKSSVEYLMDSESLAKSDIEPILKLMDVRINNLEELINDVFLMATLDAKSLVLNPEPISVGAFLEEFFFNCEADSKYNEKNLVLKVPVDFDYTVAIDTKRFIRVLDNLFGNARKYSDKGADIILDAAYISDPSGKGMVDITVSDTGYGISPENIEKIFDRSFMVSSARTPGENQSFGLGLAITRSIVEQHNGNIYCESEYGKGSTFHIVLPVV